MTTTVGTTDQVYELFIKASPEQVWEAITRPEFTAKYFYGSRIEVTPQRRLSLSPDGADTWGDNAVLEWDPPRRLVHEWHASTTPTCGRGTEPRHVGDRGAGRRLFEADRDPRPARERAEDRSQRLGRRLDDGAERVEVRARDRHGTQLTRYSASNHSRQARPRATRRRCARGRAARAPRGT